MTDPKHGTPARWFTCACKECDEAQRKANGDTRKASNDARKMTDRDRLEAFAESFPADAETYAALTKQGKDLVQRTQNGGDGTVDAKNWGHLRNIARALQELAFVLSALERGDDPDIPF